MSIKTRFQDIATVMQYKNNYDFYWWQGFPGGSDDKESVCKAGDARDVGLIPRSGRSPGGGHGNPLQYSCLENTMCINFLSSQLEMIMPPLTHRVFSQRQIT